MKKLLLLLISALLFVPAFGQTDSLQMQKIIEVPNMSMSELYLKATSWLSRQFVQKEDEFEYQDRESGKIIAKYTFNYTSNGNAYRAKQTINIDVKDEKLRITISDPFEIVREDTSLNRILGSKPMVAPKYKPFTRYNNSLGKIRAKWRELMVSLEKEISSSNNDIW